MRRLFVIIIFVLFALVAGAFFFLKPLSIFLIKKQITRACAACTVSIADCRLVSGSEFSCSGIALSQGAQYSARVKDLSVKFTLFSLLKRKATEFNLRLDSLSASGASLKEGSLAFDFKSGLGNLKVKEIKYNKLVLKDLGVLLRLKGNTIFFEALSAQILSGMVKGKARASIDSVTYDTQLNLEELDIAALINAFDLNEKFEMTGKLSGGVSVGGESLRLSILKGELSTRAEGGTLTIKDATFLENMAKTSGQSVNLLVENMKDYRYNTGVVSVFLDQGDLKVNLSLDGAAGKRNMDLVVHDLVGAKVKGD